ncbi:MAG: RsmD family RNA methyltransferase [Planctomycetota bacterium]|nr:RsmD family RNA methyltransferase [Planctomycetota bacterium]MDA1105588.1 RsmD family RNA methyltransferase [Planctomycetota bacterium]
MLRISAGEFRTRVLQTPPGAQLTRPMGSRTKEAIFNLLRGWFKDARVLDLYAGVGTMGLEAASLGAREVVLVEKDKRVLECLRTNIAALRCGDRATIAAVDAMDSDLRQAAPGPFNVIFCDPPFAAMRRNASRRKIIERLDALHSLMAPNGFLVLRVPDVPEDEDALQLPHFEGPEVHSYGNEQHVLLFAPKAATPVHADGATEASSDAAPPAIDDLPPLQ